jgi:tetratricopeptide (TPR) repeat protein
MNRVPGIVDASGKGRCLIQGVNFSMRIPEVFSMLLVIVHAATVFSAGIAPTTSKNPNARGWQLLLNNDPDAAQKVFEATIGHSDPSVSAEAYRGLSEAAIYLGAERNASRYFFISYLKDGNALYVSCPLLKTASFSRTAWGHEVKEGYKVIGALARSPGLFTGQSQEDLAARFLNDGNIKKVTTIIRDMGCLLDWRFIGPFDNISHSGYNKAFPPESEIDFSKTYPGKDGNLVQWHPLVTAPTSPWIFVEDHLSISNAVNYFYCAVTSPSDQDALLSFGASGMFKIFLNGVNVLADSVFRNTGCDMFIQKVTLRKGDNPLLIKLGHEWGRRSEGAYKYSNFSIRLLDKNYAPLKNISVSTRVAAPQAGAIAPECKRPQPIVDSVVAVLGARLRENPDDVDAALLLMYFYNSTESTDDNQRLIRSWLRRYPGSALLHSLLRESLMRSKKYTEAQTEGKTAYRASAEHFDSWAMELNTVVESGDAEQIKRFIEASPPHCRSSFIAEYQMLSANITLDNRTGVLEGISRLEKNHGDNSAAVSILAATYTEQGNIRAAKKIIDSYLKRDRTCTSLYYKLSQIDLKSGKTGAAVRDIMDGLTYTPIDASAWFYLAKLSLFAKRYDDALAFIEKALRIMPTGAGALNLKGAILEAKNDRAKAQLAYTDAITFTNDDFNAWDNLRRLNGKRPLDSIALLPAIESLLKRSASWDRLTNENGAILSYIDDIFYYPSKCSKERQFLAVYLGTQKAIDNWKEYQCGYNGNFQTCVVARALTVKANGNQVPADVNENEVVFKSLQPGDAVLLEWTVNNYYFGEMARRLWGETSFQFSSPVFDQRFRLVMPASDTIPYTVYGDSISRQSALSGDYRMVTFARPPYGDLASEEYRATDWTENRKVVYSTFSSWSSIAQWYGDLTAHVRDNTLEVQALADSLTAGLTSPIDKIKRIHGYITTNIRYSYVSFRQSGWIPQAAHDVIATRIGDCKDMASLGKTLFEKAGIKAHLVLVNTSLRHMTDHAAIGPDFNHCILAYELGGATHFMDFTDNSAPVGTLPQYDQAAMALIIAPDQTAPILLPLDSASDRRVERRVFSTLDERGTLDESITTLRTGVLAAGFRYDYRSLSPEKRKLSLHQILTKSYPDIVLDSFSIDDIDSLRDSLMYRYRYHARNTVTFSGATAIFTLHIPDALEAGDYPNAEQRFTPIDLSTASSGINQQNAVIELTLPAAWKPISLPEKVSLSSLYGTYEMSCERKGNTLVFKRRARFSAYGLILIAQYPAFRDFYNAIAKADAVQLVFSTK